MATTYTATASKKGRFPGRPYVPVVEYVFRPPHLVAPRTCMKQIMGYAFPTREEAVAYAQKYIDANYGE